MKKRSNSLGILMFVLGLAIVTLFVVINYFYTPNEAKYESYLNVFEEIEQKINTISISSINHNVEIYKSSDNKIRIGYYQKLDNTNIYTVENGKLTLKITEACEKLDNLFFKSENKINAIVIYIPDNTTLSIDVYSVEGNLNVEELNTGSITFSNVSGSTNIKSVNVDKLSIDSNSGTIIIDNTCSSDMYINSVSGKITLSYNDALAAHPLSVITPYGRIKVNGEYLKYLDEEENEQYLTEYMSSPETACTIRIESTRSMVNINTVEPVEENAESAENTESTLEN